MKTRDFKKNISGKSAKELHAMLTEKAVALRAFRFAVAGSNTRNVKEGHALKLEIAKIKTALSANKK
jgi:ribosomal protein L29